MLEMPLGTALDDLDLGFSLTDKQIETLKSFVMKAPLTDFCCYEYVTMFAALIDLSTVQLCVEGVSKTAVDFGHRTECRLWVVARLHIYI